MQPLRGYTCPGRWFYTYVHRSSNKLNGFVRIFSLFFKEHWMYSVYMMGRTWKKTNGVGFKSKHFTGIMRTPVIKESKDKAF